MSDAGPGALPGDGAAVVAGVRLPAGKRVAPALWATGEFGGAKNAWLDLRAGLRGSGLMPLLLSDLHGDPGRPWESGELRRPGPGPPVDLDAGTLLPELWGEVVPDPVEDDDYTSEVLDPYSRAFPGLAPTSSVQADAGALGAAVDSFDGPLRIGLVVARRPADALVNMGWNGAVNFSSTALLAVVLRSCGGAVRRDGAARRLRLGRPAGSAAGHGRERGARGGGRALRLLPGQRLPGSGLDPRVRRGTPGATRWSFWWD